MNLTQNAKKAVAAGLALSTLMWGTALFALPVAYAADHGTGCLVNISGTVYVIDGNQRRGFTSAEVFMSHGYNFSQVVAGNSDDADLSVGSIMVYANGTLVKGPSDPLVYLVVNGQKRGFTSGSVFTGLGYSFANIQWAPVNTFADLPMGSNIDSTSTTGLPTTGPGPQTVTCGSGSGSGLGGEEGDIESVTETGTEDANAPEGETSEVFGFELDVDGDVQVDRVDLYMEVTDSTTASSDPEDYFEGASLLVDGDEVADLDVDDFNDDTAWAVVTNGATADTEYRLRFSGLGLNFSDGEQPEFVVAFDANSVIDSDDQAGAWDIDLETTSIRFVDGRGFSDTAGAALTENFGIDAEEAADLTVSTSPEDPDGTVVEVDDENTTEGVEVFVFTIEEENGVDATINDLTVTVTALDESDAAADESTLLEDAHLYNGSDLLDSVSVAAGGVLAFEDLDLDIDADDEVDLTLKVDVADASAFADGWTLSAAITGSTDIDDAEDANGNDEGDMSPSGSATSNTHEFRESGIMVEFVDGDVEKTFTADAATEDDQGTYVLTFDVTAFGADAYIDRSAEDDNGSDAAGQGVVFDVNSTAGTPTVSSSLVEAEGTVTGDHAVSFKVEEGETRTFTLTVILTADTTPTDGSHQVIVESINWDSEAGGTDATPDFFYNFDMGDYKTPYLFLNGIA